MRVEPPRGSASADAEKVLNGSAVIQSYVLVFGVSLIVLTFRLRARLGQRGPAVTSSDILVAFAQKGRVVIILSNSCYPTVRRC